MAINKNLRYIKTASRLVKEMGDYGSNANIYGHSTFTGRFAKIQKEELAEIEISLREENKVPEYLKKSMRYIREKVKEYRKEKKSVEFFVKNEVIGDVSENWYNVNGNHTEKGNALSKSKRKMISRLRKMETSGLKTFLTKNPFGAKRYKNSLYSDRENENGTTQERLWNWIDEHQGIQGQEDLPNYALSEFMDNWFLDSEGVWKKNK